MSERPSPYELQLTEHAGPTTTGDNVDAKKVLGYVWNPLTNEWERGTGSGGTTPTISRYDYSGDPIYVGQAPTGSTESENVWFITAYNLSSSSDSSALIAANVEWTNRDTASYA